MKSLSEIETVSKRASRAAGYSWGIAEEVAKNIRLLEIFNLPGIKNLNSFFKKKKKLSLDMISMINQDNIANRFDEVGAELEQPLAIARAIKKLYESLSVTKNSWTIAKFLSTNNELRHVVRRAFIVEKFPYSEIQDNTIGQEIMPIDMLRLKLSFFGALKFDPRSDKWLRICMFQGAPLPEQLKNYDEHWVYN